MTSYTLNAEGITGALFTRVKRHPARIALDYYGRKFTYKELGEEISRYRAMVHHLTNGEAGERVALFMPNIPQFVFAYYGAIAAKGIAVLINFASIVKDLKTKPPRKVVITDDLKSQFIDSDPRVILVADILLPVLLQMGDEFLNQRIVLVAGVGEYLPAVKKLLYPIKAKIEGRWVSIPKEGGIKKLNEFLRQFENSPHAEIKTGNLDGIAQILYTTGTTGVPKGIMLTHQNLLSNSWQCREHLGEVFEEGEVVLSVLPLFHSYGLIASLYISLIELGGILVLLPSFTPKDTISAIKRCRITVCPAVNKIFQKLYEAGISRESCLSLKFWMSGAGRLDPELKKEFEQAAGVPVLEGYGLSETSPVISITRIGENKPGSVGQPVPDTSVRIVNIENGGEVKTGEEGEILVRGPQVMAGYYNKPEETKKALRDGWLYTGDIGYIDKDGFIYITDRKKEMSSVSGENVFWHQVELLLLKHPSVKKCAVIGVHHKETGEAIVAFVLLDKEDSLKDVKKYAGSSHNKLLVPREIIQVSEKVFSDWEDALGKLQKRKIKTYYETGRYQGRLISNGV